MRKKPLISIVIPTYNHANFLGRALKSVVDQTYTNWECLLIDDYSTDLSERLIEKLIIEDERFRFYKNKLRKDKKSPYQARNFGLLKSKGEYISFLDIDDYWDKNMLLIKYNLQNRNILKLRPGITSRASIKYANEEMILLNEDDPIAYNNNIIFPDKVKLNLNYYYNNNIWIDIKIIFATLFAVFK